MYVIDHLRNTKFHKQFLVEKGNLANPVCLEKH